MVNYNILSLVLDFVRWEQNLIPKSNQVQILDYIHMEYIV